MWLKPIILALGNLKEEGRFEASLSYREFPLFATCALLWVPGSVTEAWCLHLVC